MNKATPTLIDLVVLLNEVRGEKEHILSLMETEETYIGSPLGDLRANRCRELEKKIWNLETEIAKLEEGVVFVRWDMNADSWSGSRTFKSVHKTLEGAIAAIPESIRKESMKRDLYSNYVANYTYEAIEKIKLGD